MLNRPSFKFRLNLFFLKESLSLNFKHLIYVHLFINLANQFKVKLFKTVNFYSVSYLYIYLLFANVLIIFLFFIF